MELILIRHGTTQGNLEKRFIGTLDVPLAPQGEALAWQVGPTLPADGAAAVARGGTDGGGRAAGDGLRPL